MVKGSGQGNGTEESNEGHLRKDVVTVHGRSGESQEPFRTSAPGCPSSRADTGEPRWKVSSNGSFLSEALVMNSDRDVTRAAAWGHAVTEPWVEGSPDTQPSSSAPAYDKRW